MLYRSVSYLLLCFVFIYTCIFNIDIPMLHAYIYIYIYMCVCVSPKTEDGHDLLHLCDSGGRTCPGWQERYIMK